MNKKHIKYSEGQWFAIPLRSGGYAIGIIVRGNYKTKGGLGYFFGPRYDHLPSIVETAPKNKDNFIFIGWFGDLGITNGEWPLIEAEKPFKREEWPVPKFYRIPSLSPGKAVVVEYDQNDQRILHPIREYLVPLSQDILKFPKNTSYGYEAVEIELDKLLQHEEKPS